jgi:exopolyphosphatase/guanosine-5'-triphosphate,3'-diphosphate pyrophosphatase
MRRAVVDLGSNTFHALVADVDAFGVRNVVFDRSAPVRIGAHALPAGHIPDAAYARALAAVGDLVARARTRARDHFRVIATGVFRDADNGAAFLADASARHEIAIELLDGRDEARLTWTGVSAELAGSHGRLAVIDLGGGSLECAAGSDDVTVSNSLPLGVLHLRELPAADIADMARAAAGDAIRALVEPRPDTIALTSGTARSLLALARRLGLVSRVQRYVGTRTFAELARRLPWLAPEALEALGVAAHRHDTIAAGAVALTAVLDLLGRPVVYVARSGLREGTLVAAARADAPAAHLHVRAAVGAR